MKAPSDRDSLWQGLLQSDRDVVAIVPKPVLQTLWQRLARSYLQRARLDFAPNLSAHLDEPIRVHALGGTIVAGRIKGDVGVAHLSGRLRVAGNSRLKLLPPDGVELTTPIQVLEGRGRVKLDMRWDPTFLVSVVYRGFGFQEMLTGEVVPFSHVMRTRIRFAAEDSSIVERPLVRQDEVAVPCDFTERSLAKVRAALVEQDRLLRCGMVMDPDTVLMQFRRLVRRGIRVDLPRRLFKPFSLPVSLEKQYMAGDFHILARIRDPEVAVRTGYLRFGFGAELRVRSTR